jgi:hypothetical protein
VWGGAALVMLLPVAATRFSDEMAWDSADFILFGAMLAALCGAWELAVRRTDSLAYQAGVGAAAANAFLIVLAAGAVGIIGDEGDPVNLLYLGVLAIALGGAVAARFRPRGMARAMAVTAGAHVAAGLAGVILVPDLRGFLLGTGLFTPLWLLSAWLFARAARA